jgi:hypothetical protein
VSLGRILFRFVALTGLAHEASYALVEGDRFADLRQRLSRLDPRLDQLVHCQPCVATGVGVVLAALYRPSFLDDGDRRPRSAVRRLANLVADAALIGLGTRWWHDAAGLIRRELEAGRRSNEVEPAARIEIERSSRPGISIRS